MKAIQFVLYLPLGMFETTMLLQGKCFAKHITSVIAVEMGIAKGWKNG
jgi:hypothetical protein